MALVPIRGSDAIVGLIQFNDRRKDCFTLETIELMEGISSHLGEALMRKQAEAALSESNQVVQDILNNIPADGAVFQFVQKCDGSYDIPFMSESAEHIFEKPIEALQNPAGLFEELHSDDLPGMWNSIEKSAQTMEPWEYEFRIVTKTAKQKWIRGFSNPRLLDDGSICWTGMMLDITTQKRAEEALKQSEKLLSMTQKLTKVGGWEFD